MTYGLKTNKVHSMQEVFDQIVNHLRQQHGKSVGQHGCVYHDKKNGRACAIGCIIPKKLINKANNEETSFECLIYRKEHCSNPVRAYFTKTLKNFKKNIGVWMHFCKEMQDVHDDNDTKREMEEQLRNISETFNLKYTKP